MQRTGIGRISEYGSLDNGFVSTYDGDGVMGIAYQYPSYRLTGSKPKKQAV